MSLEEFPSDPNRYPEASQSTTILVLGIIGIFASVLGPIAWIMGRNELEAIDAGRRPPENRGTANAGRILGVIGTAFLILNIIVVVVFLVLFWADLTSGF